MTCFLIAGLNSLVRDSVTCYDRAGKAGRRHPDLGEWAIRERLIDSRQLEMLEAGLFASWAPIPCCDGQLIGRAGGLHTDLPAAVTPLPVAPVRPASEPIMAQPTDQPGQSQNETLGHPLRLTR